VRDSSAVFISTGMIYLLGFVSLAVLLFAALEWGRYHPVPRLAKPREPEVVGNAPPEWVAHLSTGELAELCLQLLSRMGYSMLAQTVEGDRAELTATDHTPVRSHRILMRAFAHNAGPVTARLLEETLAHARAEGVNKALVVGVNGFTRDAVRLGESLPLELLDGSDLADLSRRHMPELEVEHAPDFTDTRLPPLRDAGGHSHAPV
jgi:hypothetical protein